MKRALQHVFVVLSGGAGFFLSLGAIVWVFTTSWAIPFLMIGVLSIILNYKLAERWHISWGDTSDDRARGGIEANIVLMGSNQSEG